MRGRLFERSVEFGRNNWILLATTPRTRRSPTTATCAEPASSGRSVGVAVEIHSFSKTFNMTGWRVGWICGNADVIEALGRLKTNLDSGVFNAIQRACIAALEGPMDFLSESARHLRATTQQRCRAVQDAGIDATAPRGSFYCSSRCRTATRPSLRGEAPGRRRRRRRARERIRRARRGFRPVLADAAGRPARGGRRADPRLAL